MSTVLEHATALMSCCCYRAADVWDHEISIWKQTHPANPTKLPLPSHQCPQSWSMQKPWWASPQLETPHPLFARPLSDQLPPWLPWAVSSQPQSLCWHCKHSWNTSTLIFNVETMSWSTVEKSQRNTLRCQNTVLCCCLKCAHVATALSPSPPTDHKHDGRLHTCKYTQCWRIDPLQVLGRLLTSCIKLIDRIITSNLLVCTAKWGKSNRGRLCTSVIKLINRWIIWGLINLANTEYTGRLDYKAQGASEVKNCSMNACWTPIKITFHDDNTYRSCHHNKRAAALTANGSVPVTLVLSVLFCVQGNSSRLSKLRQSWQSQPQGSSWTASSHQPSWCDEHPTHDSTAICSAVNAVNSCSNLLIERASLPGKVGLKGRHGLLQISNLLDVMSITLMTVYVFCYKP